MTKQFVIKDSWESFKERVLGNPEPGEQLDAMRMCFFAGAGATFSGVMNIQEGDETTAEDEAAVDRLEAEVRAFGEELNQRALNSLGPKAGLN